MVKVSQSEGRLGESTYVSHIRGMASRCKSSVECMHVMRLTEISIRRALWDYRYTWQGLSIWERTWPGVCDMD